MTESKRLAPGASADHAGRLESWKEIAAYLKRGIRTVRRWEKNEGLPVHRHLHLKLSTVFAVRSELDAWQDGRRTRDAESSSAPRQRGSKRIMLAVLPFDDLSGDANTDYFADGLTEEMIGQLGTLSPDKLGVIARTTMMRYKGVGKTVRQVGAELLVDYVLEGSVRREAGRVRVTTQLIKVADQAQVWAGSHEQPLRSILGLQRELARDIGREIRLRLSPAAESGSSRSQTVDPDAYEAHLKGRYFLAGFTPESVRRSVEYLQQAVALDPSYADAFASLAEAYVQLSVWVGAPPAQVLPRALEAAQKALAFNSDLAEAHTSLGLINAFYVWDWAKADESFRRALELNPGCAPAGQWYAEFLAAMGRTDEALAVVGRARAYDPLSRSLAATGAFALWLGRRFDEAVQYAKQALEIDPKYPMALIRLGMAYLGKQMQDEAVEALRSAREAAPSLVDTTALLGYAYACAGRTEDALTELTALRGEGASRYVPPFVYSNIYLGLGQHDEAMRFMEMEFESRGWYMLLINRSPVYDPLRSHPRFQALVRRMNFPS